LLSQTLLKFELKQRNNRLLYPKQNLNIMKRTISLLTVLTFILTFSGSVFAQVSNITADAHVVSTIKSTSTQDVHFGQIPTDISSTAPTLDPTQSGSNSGTIGGTQQIGYIVFSGTANQSVSITPPSSVTLGNQNDSNFSVDFVPNLCYEDTDTSGSNTCSSAGGYGNSITVQGTNFSGTGTVWIGGKLNNATDSSSGSAQSTNSLAEGTYTHSVSISIDYSI